MENESFALILIVLSFIFLGLEFFFASGGILTFIGLMSFIIGTYLLYVGFGYMLPGVFLYVVLPLFIAVLAFVLFVVILGLKAQKASVKTSENLVGKFGKCVTKISKEKPGQIEIGGEIWTAYSQTDIEVGDQIKVVDQKSLKLFVIKEV